MNKNLLDTEDEFFKKAYDQYEAEPSGEVWKNIEAELNKEETGRYKKKLEKLKIASGVVILLLAGLNVYQHYFHNYPSNTLQGESVNKGNTTMVPQFKNNIKTPGYETQNPLSNVQFHAKDRQVDEETEKNIVETGKYNSQPFQNTFITTTLPLLNAGSVVGTYRNNVPVFLPGSDLPLVLSPLLHFGTPNSGQNQSKAIATLTGGNKTSWLLTPYLSTDFTHYYLDNDDMPGESDKIEERERHEFSFSAGILAEKTIKNNLTFKTGLIYSNTAIGIQPQTLYAGTAQSGYKYITSSGYSYVKPVFSATPAPGDSISSNIAQHHLQYISIPAMAGYRLTINRHISITPSAGIAANILLSTKVRTALESNTSIEPVTISRLEGVRPVYLSLYADVEVSYIINRQTAITILPVFKYALSSINRGNVVKTYPYSLGLGIGITRRF
ncbi:MAG TPA: hypothetical protein VG738_07360 [Chitinophagaceae bacterium]|nr:hypothetical protein [Chitinophagaceae bacterium]